MKNRTHTIWRPKVFASKMKLWLIVLALVFVISLQYAPSIMEQRRDSGIFAYTGKIILDGGLPYVDAWDNKLPGVYYIDALAFLIFGTNRWALWLTENFVIVLAALVLFWLLQQTFRKRTELWLGPLLLVLFVRHPGLVSDINFTEPYALLPQIVVFAAGYQFLRQPSYRLGFAIGFAAAVALLIKQTTIGGALMFIPAVLIARHPILGTRARWRWLGTIVLGGLTCLSFVALYLLANGILDDAIKASFITSSTYHDWVGNGSAWIGQGLINTLTSTSFLLVYGPFLPFLVVGVRVAVRGIRTRSYADRQRATDATLAIWAALTLGADVILANITNRAYEHYYVTLVPAVILLVMLSLPTFARYLAQGTPRQKQAVKLLRLEVIACFVMVPIIASFVRFWIADWTITGPERHESLSTYVAEHTDPGDTVLVWGVDTAINFQSGRDSPTQYNHGYPLIVPDEESAKNVREMVEDLEKNKPVMIVDTTLRDGTRIPPLHPLLRQIWWAEGGRRDVEQLDPIYRFVDSYCHIATEYEQAIIYRCHYPVRTGLPGVDVLIDPPATAFANLWNRLVDDYQAPVERKLNEIFAAPEP